MSRLSLPGWASVSLEADDAVCIALVQAHFGVLQSLVLKWS